MHYIELQHKLLCLQITVSTVPVSGTGIKHYAMMPLGCKLPFHIIYIHHTTKLYLSLSGLAKHYDRLACPTGKSNDLMSDWLVSVPAR